MFAIVSVHAFVYSVGFYSNWATPSQARWHHTHPKGISCFATFAADSRCSCPFTISGRGIQCKWTWFRPWAACHYIQNFWWDPEYCLCWSKCQLFSWLIACLALKMSENGETWQSVFPKAQDDILRYHVLSTTQRQLVNCHRKKKLTFKKVESEWKGVGD